MVPAVTQELAKYPAIFPGTWLWVRYAVSAQGV